MDGMTITQYLHHGQMVHVIKAHKGQHKDHCLCWQHCKRFHPESPQENCPIANALYQFDQTNNLVTPVWECPKYQPNGK